MLGWWVEKPTLLLNIKYIIQYWISTIPVWTIFILNDIFLFQIHSEIRIHFGISHEDLVSFVTRCGPKFENLTRGKVPAELVSSYEQCEQSECKSIQWRSEKAEGSSPGGKG